MTFSCISGFYKVIHFCLFRFVEMDSSGGGISNNFKIPVPCLYFLKDMLVYKTLKKGNYFDLICLHFLFFRICIIYQTSILQLLKRLKMI